MAMETELKSHLFALADAYGQATGATRKTVALLALRDNTFFDRIAADHGFTIKTYDRLVGWFADHWPPGARWPRSVDRPKRRAA